MWMIAEALLALVVWNDLSPAPTPQLRAGFMIYPNKLLWLTNNSVQSDFPKDRDALIANWFLSFSKPVRVQTENR